MLLKTAIHFFVLGIGPDFRVPRESSGVARTRSKRKLQFPEGVMLHRLPVLRSNRWLRNFEGKFNTNFERNNTCTFQRVYSNVRSY